MKSTRSKLEVAVCRSSNLLSAWLNLLVLIFPFTLTAAALPDLIVDRPKLARSILIEKHTFTSDECAIVEGCISGTGPRKLLRFAVGFINRGPGHLIIGRPEDHPELFEYSPCHGHYHFSGAARYVLRRLDGTKAAAGRKQAFCFRDTVQYFSWAGSSKAYDCEHMGITAGWEDVYTRNLDCQWLDITGVPRGNYNLVVVVNPQHILRESDYSNNSAVVPVFIP